MVALGRSGLGVQGFTCGAGSRDLVLAAYVDMSERVRLPAPCAARGCKNRAGRGPRRIKGGLESMPRAARPWDVVSSSDQGLDALPEVMCTHPSRRLVYLGGGCLSTSLSLGDQSTAAKSRDSCAVGTSSGKRLTSRSSRPVSHQMFQGFSES